MTPLFQVNEQIFTSFSSTLFFSRHSFLGRVQLRSTSVVLMRDNLTKHAQRDRCGRAESA